MKNYRVTVNGVAYQVTVEEMNGAVSAPMAAPVASAPMPVAAPTLEAAAPAAPAAAPASAPAASGSAGAVSVKAPMPGSIVKVSVKVGDAVKKGDLLCVLEAMKMENEILAPQDGVVASVEASQGVSVATDEILVTLN